MLVKIARSQSAQIDVAEDQPGREDDDPLRAGQQPDLQLVAERLGAGARVGDEDRAADRRRGSGASRRLASGVSRM